jgi:hypothetical protein
MKFGYVSKPFLINDRWDRIRLNIKVLHKKKVSLAKFVFIELSYWKTKCFSFFVEYKVLKTCGFEQASTIP